jgi:CHAT domain-containing protein
MSLWKVDDQATRLLMGAFYRNLIEKHMTKREALIEAQHYLCHYDQGQYNQPRFWAAFILLDALD